MAEIVGPMVACNLYCVFCVFLLILLKRYTF